MFEERYSVMVMMAVLGRGRGERTTVCVVVL